MGIDNVAAKMLLLLSSTQDVNLENTLFLGHQKNYVSPRLAREITNRKRAGRKSVSGEYADDFLKLVGIENSQVLDISAYEGATVIQDMNLPIPESLKGKFRNVIDIGTTEHIYNATQSIANIRDLCKVGGTVMILSPANGYLGHGFYQFSPEFFFRAFDEKFGFQIQSIYLIKKRFLRHSWYSLEDPESVGARGTIFTRKRCSLGMIATKIYDSVGTASTQQSDYVTAWESRKISRLGQIYLKAPLILRKLMNMSVLDVLQRWRARLSRQKFSWQNGFFVPRAKRKRFSK